MNSRRSENLTVEQELLRACKSQRLMLYAWKAARQNFGLPDNHTELNDAIAETEAAIARAEAQVIVQ